MNIGSMKGTANRKLTIVLSIVLVLMVLGALYVFVIHPKYVDMKSYQVYGGFTDELKDSEMFEDMQSGKSFCFLGDSITEGSDSGYQWYRPLLPYITGKTTRLSHGGWTTKDLLISSDRIPESDVYVIAIGVNDVAYIYNDDWCAETADDYIDMIDQLSQIIISKSPDAKLYFITPWILVDWGSEKDARGVEFREALFNWCDESGYICIDPAPVMIPVMNEKGPYTFLLKDGVHPNGSDGVGLYSYAVLKAAHDMRFV